MGLMDKMMDRMIKSMSSEQKEGMMLNMMPAMMQGIDINELVPDMAARMGRLITPTGAVVLAGKALGDDELRTEVGELLDDLKEHASDLSGAMRDVMPVMMSFMSATGLMDGMMNTMGKLMPTMMPMMRAMVPAMMREKMPAVMAKNDNVREMMPDMMMEVIPECIGTMLPTVADEKRSAFLARLAEQMGRTAGGDEASAEERESLEEELVDRIKAGFGAAPG